MGRPPNYNRPGTRNKTKICATCARRLPIAGYAKSLTTTDRLKNVCLDCELDPPLTDHLDLRRRYVKKEGEIHAVDH